VLLITSLIAYIIPDVPSQLQKQIRHEKWLTTNMIIHTELARAKGDVSRGAAQSQAADTELCGLISAAD